MGSGAEGLSLVVWYLALVLFGQMDGDVECKSHRGGGSSVCSRLVCFNMKGALTGEG